MERYAAYKDSGVEWIGEIPEGWKIQKISSLYDARNEKVSDKDYPPLSVTMQGILPQLDTAAKTQDGDNRKLVRKGDFAINSRSDRRGSCGVSDYDGSVSLITNVLAPRNLGAMDSHYYSYLFHTENFADEFYKNGTGIVDDLWSTNWSRMKKIQIPLPELGAQKAIAAYLDKKTAEIDGIVEETERSIELLREYRKSVISEAVTHGLNPDVAMKDSGIEWIGQIPESWGVNKLQSIASLAGRIGWQGLTSDEYTEEGPYLITGVDFLAGGIDWDSCVHITKERWEEASQIQIKNGDLLITKDGSVGKVAVVDNLESEASLNSGLMVIKLREQFATKYLFYVLSSEVFWGWFAIINAGATSIIHLYQGDFYKFLFPAPSIDEQNEIAGYLDVKTAEIDELIADKEKQVELLKEYRKSLISEAVTGKFKVPGVE